MLQVLAKGYSGSEEVLDVLLNEHLATPDEQLLEIVASGPSTLKLVLKRYPSLGITENAVLRAAGNEIAMRVLLQKRAKDIAITEKVMLEAAAQPFVWFSGSTLHPILNALGSAAPITKDVFVTATLANTEGLEVRLKDQRGVDLQEVWDSVWLSPALKIACIPDVLETLLGYADIRVTDDILKRLTEIAESGAEGVGDDLFDQTIPLFLRKKLEIRISSTSFATIFSKSNTTTLRKLIKSLPDIHVDTDLMRILEANPRVDMDALAPLFVLEKAGIGVMPEQADFIA